MEELPPPQRQALGLAFFADLSHGQIAEVLDLPLGTAKSRVRAGLLSLRGKLAPLMASLLLFALLAGVSVELTYRRRALATDERALAMLTSSDAQALRLTAAPGTGLETHGVYRFRPGPTTVVFTLSTFPPTPSGRAYQAWARHGDVWTSVGLARPDAAGKARVIAEGSAFSVRPDALQVTVEPDSGSPSPAGPVVIAWSGP
jgi:hypothetical protein